MGWGERGELKKSGGKISESKGRVFSKGHGLWKLGKARSIASFCGKRDRRRESKKETERNARTLRQIRNEKGGVLGARSESKQFRLQPEMYAKSAITHTGHSGHNSSTSRGKRRTWKITDL